MRFDLVDLRLFVAIVEAGSISRGAEAAHMALASASARVGGMERTLGVALLKRGRRGVTPTAAGRTLLGHARSVTAQVERMRGDLGAYAAGLKGEIRMLSNSAALVDLVPAALRTFLADHPNVDVAIEERTSAEIMLAVADGRCAFGVMAGSTDPGALQTRTLGIDRLQVVVARSHALAAHREIAFADLLDEPFVGLADGALHDHLATNAAKLGRRIAYRVRLRSFDAVAQLVGAGVGVGILPMAAIARYRTPDLAVLDLADNWADRTLLVCAVDFAALPAHAGLFVAALERQARAATDR